MTSFKHEGVHKLKNGMEPWNSSLRSSDKTSQSSFTGWLTLLCLHEGKFSRSRQDSVHSNCCMDVQSEELEWFWKSHRLKKWKFPRWRPEYITELCERFEESLKLAQEELKKSQKHYNKHYDKKAWHRHLKEGDQVLILLPTDSNKLLM